MNHRTPAEDRLAAGNSAPNREQQLAHENAAQRDIIAAQAQEIEALRDIFTAVSEASAANPGSHDFLIGYIGGIGTSEQGHGNARLLRQYAADIRAKGAEHARDDEDLAAEDAHEFIPCTTCTADDCDACGRAAADAVHRIAGDFGPEQVGK